MESAKTPKAKAAAPRVHAAERVLPPKTVEDMCKHETMYLEAMSRQVTTNGQSPCQVQPIPPAVKAGLYEAVTPVFLALHAGF